MQTDMTVSGPLEQKTATEQPQTTEVFAEQTGPVGIGGWLLLPILGLMGSIGLTIKNLAETPWNDIKLIFMSNNPEVTALRFPIVLSVLVAAFLIIWATTALVQIFRRSPRVPTTMTIFYIGLIVMTLIEIVAFQMIASATGEPPEPMGKELTRCIIAAAIWIPYFRMSKRVKNTFKSAETKVNEQLDKVFS